MYLGDHESLKVVQTCIWLCPKTAVSYKGVMITITAAARVQKGEEKCGKSERGKEQGGGRGGGDGSGGGGRRKERGAAVGRELKEEEEDLWEEVIKPLLKGKRGRGRGEGGWVVGEYLKVRIYW